MGTLNSTPTGPEMPLNLWAGIQGQRLRRAQARHERMVRKRSRTTFLAAVSNNWSCAMTGSFSLP